MEIKTLTKSKVKTEPIITSLLDNDLYKFTMMQVVFHWFSNVMVEYNFKLRKPDIDLSKYADEIKDEINAVGQLTFSLFDINYLSSLSFIKPTFIEFLRRFKLDPSDVIITTNPFTLRIKGPWWRTILWEVPILSIISEVYARNNLDQEKAKLEGVGKLMEKIHSLKSSEFIYKNRCLLDGIIAQSKNKVGYSPDHINELLKSFKFAEFGTRRRYSGKWQDHVVGEFVEKIPDNIIGTSNLFLARKYKIKPIGTMAHEYICACQALTQLKESQKYAFDIWAREYRGELGIALTDTISMDAFLKDFDLYFAKLFDGARHDSGNPYIWGDKLVNHYQKLGIDSSTKSGVWSDNLNFNEGFKIMLSFYGKLKTSFGIGTWLTNDFDDHLSIVIKMVTCNGLPVAKLSDSPGKSMCEDEEYVKYVKKVFSYGR